MRFRLSLITSLIMLALLTSSSTVVGQEGPGDKPGLGQAPTAIEATVASKISYQGVLRENGSLVTGTRNMTFQFFTTSACSGTALFSVQNPGVAVTNGLFNVLLDVNQDYFNGQALWLRVVVGSTNLGCQEIVPAPYAFSLLPGSEIIGSRPSYSMRVENSGTGDGLRTISNTSGTNWAAMYAVNTGTGSGVYGSSSQGYGGFFTSSNDHFDLALGGQVGRINSDPADQNSNLILSSNNDVEVRLDNDGGENGVFRIASSTSHVFSVDENGRTTTRVLAITGGSDLAEAFQVNAAGRQVQPVPGAVVSIDPDHPGHLMVSNTAYDRKVAGIVSGAGGVKAGMIMSQEGTLADGELPVALSGRVYCWADASFGPIQPGDLLTTSDTPGHVMRVTDTSRAQGAIIGKAMSQLDEGKGWVLVLVSLQ
jgi:hypothetical protein